MLTATDRGQKRVAVKTAVAVDDPDKILIFSNAKDPAIKGLPHVVAGAKEDSTVVIGEIHIEKQHRPGLLKDEVTARIYAYKDTLGNDLELVVTFQSDARTNTTQISKPGEEPIKFADGTITEKHLSIIAKEVLILRDEPLIEIKHKAVTNLSAFLSNSK